MHLVLNMFIFTRTLVTYARTIFKPRCCLNFQSMRTQAESTYIAHNMFGQIKMEIPWYINRHTLISRKRDGKPRMICFKSAVNSCMGIAYAMLGMIAIFITCMACQGEAYEFLRPVSFCS